MTFTPRKESNDCAIWALANAASVDYETVYAWAAALGRKPRRRTSGRVLGLLVARARDQGVPLRKMALKRRTIAAFVKQWPCGRYYVRVANHLLPIIDGAVGDNTSARKIIKDVWRIEA